MTRRAVQPLNQRAARAADDAIAPDTDGRRLTCYRDDARYRRRWMDAYVANGGEVEEVSDSASCGRRPIPPEEPVPPVAPVTPCPCADATITSETVVNTDPAVFSLTNPAPFAAGDHDVVLPRDRHRIGVGEEVRLTYSRGFATWTLVGEGRFVRDGGHGRTADGTTVCLVAGEVDGTIDIEARGAGCHAQISFTVVAPQSLLCVAVSGLLHNWDMADVGAYMNKRIGPKDVSFVNVGFLELDAFAVATGMWTPNHGLTHNPTGVVVQGTERVKRLGGTWLAVADQCYSGTTYDNPDFRAGVSGEFYHDIPYVYGVGGNAPSHTPRFSPVRQSVVTHNFVAGPAVSELTKAGCRVTCLSEHRTENMDDRHEPLPASRCTAP